MLCFPNTLQDKKTKRHYTTGTMQRRKNSQCLKEILLGSYVSVSHHTQRIWVKSPSHTKTTSAFWRTPFGSINTETRPCGSQAYKRRIQTQSQTSSSVLPMETGLHKKHYLTIKAMWNKPDGNRKILCVYTYLRDRKSNSGGSPGAGERGRELVFNGQSSSLGIWETPGDGWCWRLHDVNVLSAATLANVTDCTFYYIIQKKRLKGSGQGGLAWK